MKGKNVLIIFIIMLLIGGGVILYLAKSGKGPFAPKHTTTVYSHDETLYFDDESDVKEWEEKYAEIKREERENTPSDIEGMSLQDKKDAGLLLYEGSDTDQDGLSDKEEIEVYNTDPLKASTSGDLYQDGYKVKNNMDLFSTYDAPQSFEFKNKKNDEVILEAIHAEDLNTYAERGELADDASGRLKFSFKNNEKPVAIYAFESPCGHISIDLSDICPDLSKDDLNVFIVPRSHCKYEGEVQFSLENNILTPDCVFDHKDRDGFYLCIAQKAGENAYDEWLKEHDYYMPEIDDERNYYPIEDIEKHAICICKNPVLTLLSTKRHPEIYYVSTGIKEADEELIEEMYKWAIDYTASNNKYDNHPPEKFFFWTFYTTTYEVAGTEITEQEYQRMLKAQPESKRRTVFYEEDAPSGTWWEEVQMFGRGLSFFTYDDIKDEFADDRGEGCFYTRDIAEQIRLMDNEIKADEEEHREEAEKHFYIKRDILPFVNFSSKYTEGNCAAFSLLTAKLYNKGSIPATGSYYVTSSIYEGDVSYDLTVDDELKTLTDPGLRDFKDFFYSDILEGSSEKELSVVDEEFVKMMGCLWREYNDRKCIEQPVLYCWESVDNIDAYYTYKTVENIMEELDKDHVVMCSIRTVPTEYDTFETIFGSNRKDFYNISETDDSTYSGHSIIIYGYEYFNGELHFKVYDSNYPYNIGYRGGTQVYVSTEINVQVLTDAENPSDNIVNFVYAPYYCDSAGYHHMSYAACDYGTDIDGTYWCNFFTDDFELLNEYAFLSSDWWKYKECQVDNYWCSR